MAIWAEDDFPGLRAWRPIDSETKGAFPFAVPDDAWIRALPDDSRGGLPAFVHEVAWVTPGVVHLASVDGFTLDDGAADGVDERSVLQHERIELSDVERADLPLESGNGTVVMKDGRQLPDPPAVLFVSNM